MAAAVSYFTAGGGVSPYSERVRQEGFRDGRWLQENEVGDARQE